MYKIGDNIVYGSSGVMTVVDIKDDDITGETKTYYLLREYGRASSSVTFVPQDNERLISLMHPVLTREEALGAFDEACAMADIAWIPEGRTRAESYKSIVKNANRAEILAMIRTIHKTGLSRVAIGKKNFIADENVMNRAEAILALEFSISLGVSEAEVREIIKTRIKGVE